MLQQTPRAVTGEPPSVAISPPLNADVALMFVRGAVVTVASKTGLVVNEMMRDFPRYKDQLQSINDRMQDLIIPFRRIFYRIETMQESSSLKMVLPALCPEFSYKEMEISDGKAASNAFLDLYYCQDEEHKTRTRQHLLDYCNLDTLDMVKILEVLKGV